MDNWTQRVNDSLARNKAIELRDTIAKLDLTQYKVSTQDYLNRASLVAETTLNRLDTLDARLINVNALNNLGSSLESAVANYNAWTDGPSFTYISSNLQNDLDNASIYLAQLGPSIDLKEARESISTLRRVVAGHRTAVNRLIGELEEKGTLADTSIDEKVAEANKEFEKINQAVDDLQSDLLQVKNASTTVTTEQQTAFTKAEADRSAKFSEILSKNQEIMKNKIDEIGRSTEASVQEIKTKAEDDKRAIEQAKSEVERLLSIVGEEALIGDYSINAKDEKKPADIWSYVAASSILLAIIVGIAFAHGVSSSTSWQYVVAKVGVILAFGGLAGYAAKQSSEHRSAQREASRMALQLNAVKPYLMGMKNDGQRDDLMVKIADKLFGHKHPDIKGEAKSEDYNALIPPLLEALTTYIKHSK
ncbi:MAG TPA: hypothetical protein VLF71_00975 [Candidatus Saccharimonadales bacterium]|nr:hypothetical protein [Candidatus Saccharimonadales bacterium]